MLQCAAGLHGAVKLWYQGLFRDLVIDNVKQLRHCKPAMIAILCKQPTTIATLCMARALHDRARFIAC